MDDRKKEIVKEIAGNISMGLECYYHPQTHEIISIPNEELILDRDEFSELYSEQLKKIEENESELIFINIVPSFMSYKIMERFVEKVPEKDLRHQLRNALNRNRPFNRFIRIIDSSDYRQKWFDFKQAQFEEIVAKQLE